MSDLMVDMDVDEDRELSELDFESFVDKPSGKHILFSFEDEETFLVDVCNGNHETGCNPRTYVIKL